MPLPKIASESANWKLAPFLAYLFVEQVEGQLEPDSPHIRPFQRSSHVEVHVEKPLHGIALLPLLDLELRQQVDEPLE